jgi:hypothetical protein
MVGFAGETYLAQFSYDDDITDIAILTDDIS